MQSPTAILLEIARFRARRLTNAITVTGDRNRRSRSPGCPSEYGAGIAERIMRALLIVRRPGIPHSVDCLAGHRFARRSLMAVRCGGVGQPFFVGTSHRLSGSSDVRMTREAFGERIE
jgi:hypothetical protein